MNVLSIFLCCSTGLICVVVAGGGSGKWVVVKEREKKEIEKGYIKEAITIEWKGEEDPGGEVRSKGGVIK